MSKGAIQSQSIHGSLRFLKDRNNSVLDQDMKHPLPVVRCYDSYTYAREYQSGLMVGWFEPEAKPAFKKGRVPKDWPKHVTQDLSHFRRFRF